jgi:hypothetical protein
VCERQDRRAEEADFVAQMAAAQKQRKDKAGARIARVIIPLWRGKRARRFAIEQARRDRLAFEAELKQRRAEESRRAFEAGVAAAELKLMREEEERTRRFLKLEAEWNVCVVCAAL